MGGVAASEEYVRGIATSAVVGIGTNVAAGVLVSRWSNAFAYMTVLGNVLGYLCDIVFAKRAFRVHPSDATDTVIPYTDVVKRVAMVPRLVASESTIRFVVVTVLDTVVGSVF